jgi:hypothetical protein
LGIRSELQKEINKLIF